MDTHTHIGIFSKCHLGRAIKHTLFDTPDAKILPGSNITAPFVFLGDEAFPLLNNLLKPYPRDQSVLDRKKAVFNYRLSRARRIVENAFGLLSQHFRIFYTPIYLDVSATENLITCACILQNLIIDERGVPTDMGDLINNELQSLPVIDEVQTHSPQELKFKIRDTFMEYFNSTGSVSWQNDTFRL